MSKKLKGWSFTFLVDGLLNHVKAVGREMHAIRFLKQFEDNFKLQMDNKGHREMYFFAFNDV